jgi:hypothetical protein
MDMDATTLKQWVSEDLLKPKDEDVLLKVMANVFWSIERSA